MDRNNKEFLTTFKSAYTNMIATSESSYDSYGNSFYRRERSYKNYTEEEIKSITESGSLEAKIALSRYYFNKGGFYQRILLHYATLLKYTGLLIPNPSFGHSLSDSYIVKKYNG